MRRAWFEQAIFHDPGMDGVGTYVDRFEGGWQDTSSGEYRCGYSPPLLTLDEAREWCAATSVACAYVDALRSDADDLFTTERSTFFGRAPESPPLDEPALLRRSTAYEGLRRRRWRLRSSVSLAFADYDEAAANVRAQAPAVYSTFTLLADEARVTLEFEVDAPTEHMACGWAAQATKHAISWTSNGLADRMSDGLHNEPTVLSPLLKRDE